MPAPYKKPFAPGDVVWGPDAYHEDDPLLQGMSERPWLIVSNDTYPGQGQQYLVCALTHTPTSIASMVRLDPKDWGKGGTPKPSNLDTETVITLKHGWVTKYSGNLKFGKLQQARRLLKSYL